MKNFGKIENETSVCFRITCPKERENSVNHKKRAIFQAMYDCKKNCLMFLKFQRAPLICASSLTWSKGVFRY